MVEKRGRSGWKQRKKQRRLIGVVNGGRVEWGRRGRRVGVEEVGASEGAAEGAGSTVVGNGGVLGGVEGAEPMTLFGGRISDLGGISTPGSSTDSEETVGRRFCGGRGVVLSFGFGGRWTHLCKRRRRF